ncbi:MAG: DEAD/DEAH box helicase [Methanobrevibacter sp.]|jgi:SNF2 family DNA or RNA helicase/uncharacterized Zn finger protein|nr:DEAD/DEAH box helicase [Methanobrevibacter sp.]
MVKYGKTWWGIKWLEALNGIDLSNRLPRGKTYANTGKVHDIEIFSNVVSSKVDGNFASYYNVKIMPKSFNEAEKTLIAEVINNSPSILSALINKKLPEELYDELIKLDIQLFPSDWSQINADCNCPDYAMPCKHIAALIYMISTEIDKDPFVAFKIHDCDLLSMIGMNKKESNFTRHITKINEIFSKKSSKDNLDSLQDYEEKSSRDNLDLNSLQDYEEIEDKKNLNEISFSSITNLSTYILAMLKSEPLFYEKDFKKILEKMFKAWTRYFKKPFIYDGMNDFCILENKSISLDKINNVSDKKELEENKEEIIEDIFSDKWGNPQNWETLKIIIDDNYTIFEISNSNKIDNEYKNKVSKKNNKNTNLNENIFLNEMNKDLNLLLTGFLLEIPQNTLHKYNPNIQFLHLISQFTYKLMENSGLIPEVLETPNKSIIVRWIPALFDKNIEKIVDKLSKYSPKDLINHKNEKISFKEQLKIAISLIASGMIHHFNQICLPQYLENQMNNPVFKLFFKGEAIEFDSFQSEADTELIHQWLSNLYFRERDYDLYLTVHEEDELFTIELNVGIDDNPLESVYDVIQDKKNYRITDKKIELLSDLYLIQEYLPQLNKSVDEKKPIKVDLDEFHYLFMEIIPLLEIMGISIILPKSLEKVLKPKISLNIKNNEKNMDNKGYLSLDKLLVFKWEIAIGDHKLSIEEFKNLLEKSKKLVKIANEYVILDKKDMKSLLKKIDKLPDNLNQNELMKAILSGQLDEAEVNIDKELNTLFKNINKTENLKVPKNLKAKLRPYQEIGFSWLVQNINSKFGSILADDMGLGKTLQVLTTILYLKNHDLLDNKVLVVAPTSLLFNWEREIEKFTPTLKPLIYHGQNRHIPDDNTYDILITSYGIIRSDEEEFKKKKWFIIVIDEAQNIKNPYAKQTKSVKSIKAQHKIALSGTPVENRLSDYWSIFDFTNKHYLSTIKQFSKKFIIPIEKERDKGMLENFKKITKPFILRRLKNDKTIIDDLPEKIENDLYCSLTIEQAGLYQEMIDSIMEKIDESDGMDRKGLILKLINGLKQICNHPSQFRKNKHKKIEDSGKMQLLFDIVQNIIDNEEKAIIFTQYVEMGNIIKSLLEKKLNLDIMFLNGSLSRKVRDQMVYDFQNNSQKRIFIVSLRAGGTGLNLTAAKNVIHYDLWWNPAVENQATDRAYRIGQKENVMVYRLISAGTFEERINDMIKAKKELAEITVGSGENFVTEMSNEDLKELLNLRNI